MVAQANDRQNLLYIDDEGDGQGSTQIQNKSSRKSMPGSKRESEKGRNEVQSVPMNVILLKNEVDLE